LSFEPHRRGASSITQLYLAGAFLGAVLFLLGYPSFLMIVHDLPSPPSVGFRRLLEPVGPLTFPFEELALALLYILSFILGYTFLFGRAAKYQFILISTVLALIGYTAAIYLIGHTSPMQIYQLHISCVSGGLSCYPYLVHGIVILFATALSMIFTERMLLRWANRDAFGYPLRRFPARNFALIACLLGPILIYPSLLMLLNDPSSVADFRANIFTAPVSSFHSTVADFAAVFATSLFSALALTMVSTGNNRKSGLVALIILLTVAIFYLFVYLDIYFSGAGGRRFACIDRGLHACLSYWERAWLLALAFGLSTILIERAFRHFGRAGIYQDTQ